MHTALLILAIYLTPSIALLFAAALIALRDRPTERNKDDDEDQEERRPRNDVTPYLQEHRETS